MKLSLAMPCAIAAVALAGCSGTVASTVAGHAAAPAAGQPAPAAGANASSCTTHVCIAADMQRSLVGLIVKDKSIVTRAACRASTVQHHVGNTWTAKCTATYLDGTKESRSASYIPTKRKIVFVG